MQHTRLFVQSSLHLDNLVGYHRYDTAAEFDLLNQIWTLDDAFGNYFLPSLKLAPSTVTAPRSSRSTTEPPPRTSVPSRIPLPGGKRPIITMNARFKKLRLGALQRETLHHTGRIARQRRDRVNRRKPVRQRLLPNRRFPSEATISSSGGIDMRHHAPP